MSSTPTPPPPGFDGAHLHGDRLDAVASRLADSIAGDARTRRVSAAPFPHRRQVVDLLERLTWLMFPGFVGPRELAEERLRSHVEELARDIAARMHVQVAAALRCTRRTETGASGEALDAATSQHRAREVATAFLGRLPEVRRRLSLDVQAAYDGDPAAETLDEVIFSYPGIHATTIHRLAHELHALGVPLLPRIMSEHAHSVTGIDIHPGARIGESFFIDHGTGVVIGGTSVIGAHCRLYQGVTLGSKTFPKDERGRAKRGIKRHPTLEDHVTVYAGATILGGDTVIGAGSVINGGVFLTESVPPGSVVRAPKLDLKTRSNPELPPGNYSI